MDSYLLAEDSLNIFDTKPLSLITPSTTKATHTVLMPFSKVCLFPGSLLRASKILPNKTFDIGTDIP
jgi:hypothetical protein